MIVRLADIGPAQPGVGGKARGLARARGAGLAVPDGLVLTDAGDDPGAAASLGEPLIVRSSAEVEDGAAQAAAGVFASRRDVAFRDLAQAIAAVRASADGDTARAYARARGLRAPFAMATIVQRQVAGVRGTAYSRAFGADGVLVEAGDDAVLVPRDGGPARGRIPGVDAAAIARAALAGEAALGRPADLEWVLGDDLWVVQLRPAVAAATPAPPPAFVADLARLDPAATWTWDAVHNPEPLSPAQRGLVDLVADAAPIRQEVVGGYLYTAPGGAPPEPVEPDAIPAIFAALDADIAAMTDDVEATLAAYRAFYRRYALVLGPSLERVARAPGSLRRAHPDLAPAWDVAVPTFGETPGLVDRLPSDDAPAPPHELDDVYFARAQAGVRRALLALGLGDDVFWLPLADVRAGRLAEAAARARAARREHEALRAFVPPRTILGTTAVWGAPPGTDILHGRGTGGRARGRVARIDPRSPAPVPPGRVVAAPTLTPAMTLLCRNAAALVAEHGGLLGHAAALARELGIPCIVGCAGADRLQEGDEVWVDADEGLVFRV